MSTYKFADFFNPNEDPNFDLYSEYLFSLIDILDPLFKNRVTDCEETLNEIHSLLAYFAQQVYLKGCESKKEIVN